jgi:hypothetical protein
MNDGLGNRCGPGCNGLGNLNNKKRPVVDRFAHHFVIRTIGRNVKALGCRRLSASNKQCEILLLSCMVLLFLLHFDSPVFQCYKLKVALKLVMLELRYRSRAVEKLVY